MADTTARIAVVGGGIAGLAAAWEATGGPGRVGAGAVVVLESSDRLGGRLATVPFAGRAVDVGPDGFLGRRPEAAELCREIGLGERLVPIGASGAAIWARGRRRPMPAGLAMGVPTRWWPVARSGILTPGGSARLARDLVAPRPDRRGPLGDRAIGPLVARKLGHQVVDQLVDPLLGGINAGSVSDASAAAVYPLLLAVAQRRGSFMRNMRRAQTIPEVPPTGMQAAGGEGTSADGASPGGGGGAPDAAPAFWAVSGGMEALTTGLGAALAARGVEIRTSAPVSAIARDAGGWVLETPAGTVAAEAVVLAVPAGPASALLAPHDADAAAVLGVVEYASVALVTLAFPEPAGGAGEAGGAGGAGGGLYGTGLLVPHPTPYDRDPFLVTACTYLTQKWPHLGGRGDLLVRASVGRYADVRYQEMDDGELVARVAAELTTLLGIQEAPTASLVTRWDDALPQYRVHHLLRVAAVEAAAQRLGGLAVAGAAYRGLGIPACIASGRAAARELTAT